jgi:deazaflavin-dependent oxidoreductase (nitroreductase family)
MRAMSEQTDINAMNRQVIEQFRASGGKVVEGRFSGANLLLLTTQGARTGATRVNPLMYYRDGERPVIFASRRGGPHNPAWYHNLVANPDVTVEIGSEKYGARALVASGEERRRIWDDAARAHPFLNEHQANTRRQIPVIVLERK